jgi:hypothetical protein
VVYTLVNKKITHRLFVNKNGRYDNPPCGTVIDTALVESQGEKIFDFLMIPHVVTQASALPVHFKVVLNNSKMAKEDIIKLTYHLCYAYYNFGGPIKVPSACMYAQKVAQYFYEIRVIPNK